MGKRVFFVIVNGILLQEVQIVLTGLGNNQLGRDKLGWKSKTGKTPTARIPGNIWILLISNV